MPRLNFVSIYLSRNLAFLVWGGLKEFHTEKGILPREWDSFNNTILVLIFSERSMEYVIFDQIIHFNVLWCIYLVFTVRIDDKRDIYHILIW